jgi:hypothetical protein
VARWAAFDAVQTNEKCRNSVILNEEAHMGDGIMAENDPLRRQIHQAIDGLSSENLRHLTLYIDFLRFRDRHVDQGASSWTKATVESPTAFHDGDAKFNEQDKDI